MPRSEPPPTTTKNPQSLVTFHNEFISFSRLPFYCVGPLLRMSRGLKILLTGHLFQGRFSINLYGTGLSLTESARWISQGNYAVSDIKKSPVMVHMAWSMSSVFSSSLPPSEAMVLKELPQTILQSVRKKIEDINGRLTRGQVSGAVLLTLLMNSSQRCEPEYHGSN